VLTQRTRSPWTAHARVVAGPREVIHLV